MTNERRQEIERANLAPETVSGEEWQRAVVVTVEYDEGGPHIFSGRMVTRGYYLNVALNTTRESDGFRTRRFGVGDGTAMASLIESAQRFGAAKLAKLARYADSEHREKIDDMVRYVIQKSDEAKARYEGAKARDQVPA